MSQIFFFKLKRLNSSTRIFQALMQTIIVKKASPQERGFLIPPYGGTQISSSPQGAHFILIDLHVIIDHFVLILKAFLTASPEYSPEDVTKANKLDVVLK